MGVATVELLYNTTNTTVGATSVDVTSSLVLTSFSYTFTTTPNTAYYYWLKLTNEQGGETTTALGLYTTQDNTAPVIATFTAAQGTDTETEIDLAISVTDNDAVNQIYTLLVTDSGARSIAQIQAGDAHAPGTTAVTYSNLTPDTQYWMWITATDDVGNDTTATRSTPNDITTADITAPTIVTSTMAAGGDPETQIDMTISVTDNGAVANIYTLLTTDSGAKTIANIQAAETHAAGTTAVTYSNLTPDTVYYGWITADDTVGNDAAATRFTPSNVETTDTTPPVIASFTAAQGTDTETQIDLAMSVSDNSTSVANIYTLLATDASAKTVADIQLGDIHSGVTTAVTYSNLSPNTQYWAWMTADDANGNDAAATRSTPSNVTTADITAPVIATSTMALSGTDPDTEIDMTISVTDNDAVNQIYTLLVTDSGARTIANIQAAETHAAGTTAVTYSNLTPGTQYWGWITADDAVGNDAAATRFTPNDLTTWLYAPDITKAVDFDGTNDYGVGTGSATVDSKVGIVSSWVRFDTTGSTEQWVSIANPPAGGSGRVVVGKTASEQLFCQGKTSGGATVFSSVSTQTFSTGTWYHVLVAWDAAAATLKTYVNDTAWTTSGSVSNLNVYWNESGLGIGGWIDGTAKLNGCMAEMYATNEYLDMATEANRRKFISAGGAPVSLGTDGSTPTGTQPLVYISGDQTNWNAGANFGSWSDFTMTGAVTDCATAP